MLGSGLCSISVTGDVCARKIFNNSRKSQERKSENSYNKTVDSDVEMERSVKEVEERRWRSPKYFGIYLYFVEIFGVVGFPVYAANEQGGTLCP